MGQLGQVDVDFILFFFFLVVLEVVGWLYFHLGVGLIFVDLLVDIVDFLVIHFWDVILLNLIDHFVLNLLILIRLQGSSRVSFDFVIPSHVFFDLELGNFECFLAGQVTDRISVDGILVEEPNVDLNSCHSTSTLFLIYQFIRRVLSVIPYYHIISLSTN